MRAWRPRSPADTKGRSGVSPRFLKAIRRRPGPSNAFGSNGTASMPRFNTGTFWALRWGWASTGLLWAILSSGDSCAFLFALEAATPLILGEMESAGRAKLRIQRAEAVEMPSEKGTSVRDTVSSMRLDAVASAGFSLGRAEAQELIRRGLVKLNHLIDERTDARVRAGDLISIRGYGRLRVGRGAGFDKKRPPGRPDDAVRRPVTRLFFGKQEDYCARRRSITRVLYTLAESCKIESILPGGGSSPDISGEERMKRTW